MSRVRGSHRRERGRPVAGHPAFSLIEVLIGIVVLALGLVGLAAVFPTVVRQQQVASDQASAVSAVKSAIASLKEHAELSRPVTDAGLDAGGYPYAVQGTPNTVVGTDLVGWSVLTWDVAWSPDLSWELPVSSSPSSTAMRGANINPATGEYVLGRQRFDYAQILRDGARVTDPRSIRLGGVTIPMKDRLIPEARPGLTRASQPRFVWDFVTRRVDLGDPHLDFSPTLSSFRDDGVQVAVFVRRIDPGIRIPTGLEVSDVIGVAGSPSRVAVAAAPNNSPTLDGMGGDGVTPRYSMVQPLTFAFANINSAVQYDVLDITGPAPLLPYAAQVGQLFVDQFGVVHKVVEVKDAPAAGTRRVRLDEAFREDYEFASPSSPNRMTLIFTPQIPASVDVFTISPSRQKPQ